ncbi:MAG: META domain-containing protein [Methanomicrobium sp.]|nr:META domain-containing protein [Methanomicrobium sp.]
MTDKDTLKIITLACAVVVVFAVAITAGCIGNNTTGNAGAGTADNAVNAGNNGNAVGTDKPVGTGAAVGTGSTGSGLIGTEWVLESIANESGLQPVPSGVTVTLKFDEKTLGGNGGCNGYGAIYTTDSNKLSINQESFMSTLMYCDASSPTEAAYKTALTEVASYKISGDKLELSDDNGKVLLVFNKMNA